MSGGGSPFNCETCADKDKSARNCLNRLGLSKAALAVSCYTDDVVAEHKEKGGVKVVSLGNIRLYECPVSFLTDDTRELMRLCFFIEETGNLLYEGGWGGQPYWLVEAYEVCRREAIRLQKEKRDG